MSGANFITLSFTGGSSDDCGGPRLRWALVLTLLSLVWSAVYNMKGTHSTCLTGLFEVVSDPSLKVFKVIEPHWGVYGGGVYVSNGGNVWRLQGGSSMFL